MSNAILSGRTIMIVHSDIEGAAPLQDRIVQAGGRALTAYSLSRALYISKHVALDDALIDFEFTGAAEVISVLKERHVPHIVYAPGNPRGMNATANEPSSTEVRSTVSV